MYFIGIDPGQKGGTVLINNTCEILDRRYFTGLNLNIEWPKNISHAFLEQVHAFPGQGLSSTFNFGTHYGMIQGYLYAKEIPVTLVSPVSWQKILPEGTTPKDRVKLFCDSTWGLERFILKGCRIPHQGLMDAACIAEYGRRLKLGEIEAPTVRPKQKKRAPIKLG